MHNCNAIDLSSVLYIQSLYDGNDKSCDIGLKDENKALNRFKNIIACQFNCHKNIRIILYDRISFSDDDNLVILTTSDGYNPTNIYINSGFVDVRKLLNNDNYNYIISIIINRDSLFQRSILLLKVIKQ